MRYKGLKFLIHGKNGANPDLEHGELNWFTLSLGVCFLLLKNEQNFTYIVLSIDSSVIL